MIGGPSVTAAVPLRTNVTAWRASGTSDVVLSSNAPIYRTRILPATVVARRRYLGEVLDHMQAAARVTLGSDGQLPGLVLTASTASPVAAGVASSAAVTLAACAALTCLDGTAEPDVGLLCELAYQVESTELRVGSGWMDYLACAHGGVNAIESTTPPSVTRVADSLGVPLVLVDTMERRSTKSVLAAKRTQLVARDPAMLTYVARTAELAITITSELTSADVDYRAVGAWLNTAQDLLAHQARCSTPLIDACIERALAAGAYGAKLTGSGHGGCFFALVPPDATAAVLAALEDLPVHTQALPACEPAGLATRSASLGGCLAVAPS
jgi:mevalonate kinase